MRVWRIENADGRGAYYIKDEDGDYALAGTVSEMHPMPQDDELLWDMEWKDFHSPRFGFSRLEDFLDWFTDEMIEIMSRHDAYLVEYRCRKVQLGTKQCVFDRRTSRAYKRVKL